MNPKYQFRINQALQYIESNLPNKISLDEVAKVSCFSPFHFHRVFTGIVGETVNDYIARRRLECAVNVLVFKPELSVTEVALNNGFSSSANFAKAVKLHFGFSPTEIRDPKKTKDSKIGKITSKYGKVFNPSDLYPMCTVNLEDKYMNVKVIELPRQRVCTLSSEEGYQQESIYNTWDKLIDWAVAHGIGQQQQQRFAFCFDNPAITPIDKCRYTASIVVGDDVLVNSPFTETEIPEGKYAVLYFKGSKEETIRAEPQLSLYTHWLPNSGFEPDNFPMLERYLNDVRVDGYIEMEVYVKLKAL